MGQVNSSQSATPSFNYGVIIIELIIGFTALFGILGFFCYCLYMVFQGGKVSGEMLGDHWDHVDERKCRERAKWKEEDNNRNK